MPIFGFGKSYKPADDMELLTTVYDFGMRSIIESLLRDENIPYIIKDRGGSLPVITGSSVFGTDFFVRKEDLDAAAELIGPCFGEELSDDEIPSDEDSDGNGDEQ